MATHTVPSPDHRETNIITLTQQHREGQALQQYAYDPAIIDQAVITGDMAKMPPEMRLAFYKAVCLSAGLNPLTQPFTVLKRQDGTTWLYANSVCSQQLAAIHRVSFEDIQREHSTFGGEPLYTVRVTAVLPDGRRLPSQAVISLTKKKREVVGHWEKSGDPKFRDVLDADGEPVLLPLRGEGLANALMKCDCVPLDSEILTRDGWKTHEQVMIGESVLAYDCETDTCRWTPLEGKTVYPEGLTMRFGTALHNFRCTPDHSWAIKAQSYKACGRGKRALRGPYKNRQAPQRLVQAHAIKTGHRVILAAPAESGTSALTPAEAAILGWVMTDGSIQRRRSYVRLAICQSKPETVEVIDTLLTGTGYAVSKYVGAPTVRDFGSYVSECLPQTWWYFSGYDSKALLAKAEIESPADLPRLVTRLSSEARTAMFAAMMAADGDKKGRFGKKRKPGVMEARQILATLEGHALGKWHDRENVPTQTARQQRYIAGSNVQLTEPLIEPVWCPTTAYGTWVMRQGQQVTITGNTKALRRATLALVGLGWMLSDFEGRAVTFDLQTGALEDDTPVVPRSNHLTAPAEQAKDTAAHAADLYGDGVNLQAIAETYRPRIEAIILAQPGGNVEDCYRWAERQRHTTRHHFTEEDWQWLLDALRKAAALRHEKQHEATAETAPPPDDAPAGPTVASQSPDELFRQEEEDASEYGE